MSTTSKSSRTKSFDETVGSILPSYMMYTQTIGMNVNVPEDNGLANEIPPPNYSDESDYSAQSAQFSNLHSSISPNTCLSSIETPVDHNVNIDRLINRNDSDRSLIVADENTNWRETVLDNVHKLPNMTFENNIISNSVKIEIFFTKKIGEINKKPELIDPSIYEYSQGDLINGYVTIKNTSDKRIPFEMFYLMFEGNFMVANPKNVFDKVPIKIRRFLEMFDFFASYNEAHINRLSSEVETPYSCEYYTDKTDPIDGTYLYFGPDKAIKPNRTYKRFFSFKIPNNLLDSECNDHNLSKHIQLPPTVGLSRWELSHFPEREQKRLRDLSLMNTSIGYGIMARFIGRKSTWESEFGTFETPSNNDCQTKIVNSKGDEYIILKELTNHFRVIPTTRILSENEKLMKQVENRLLYENLVKRIKDKIEIGEQLLKSIEENKFDSSIDLGENLTQLEIAAAKLRQSYTYQSDSIKNLKSNIKKLEYYELLVPLAKKSFGGVKNLGVLSVKTPKQEYTIKYIPPTRFRVDSIDELASTWNLNIPLDFVLDSPSKERNPPPTIIKNISCELVVHSIRSINTPIPIEIDHDLIYNKSCDYKVFHDSDSMLNNLIKPMQKDSTKLYQIFKKLGPENFKLERQLVDDLKSICQLEEKIINLSCNDVKIFINNNNFSLSKSKVNWSNIKDSQSLTTSLNLQINLQKLSTKGSTTTDNVLSFDKFNLVPDFQSCYMAILYHLKLVIFLSTGDCLRLKVPVRIEK
ncbi:hypothetical protein KGF54_002263 [Candida jiufengensis]|uniref:uncharacterized protein n=1 Tax=Candida jiufengensis TaxID=497108 RepID=UPI0022254C26|nr:uncharacterized protein KGF54_002263 [Candida jiufengensis]KAI5954488.1 hypothetical protein KGF54_002263 [Candida jiufengensis]